MVKVKDLIDRLNCFDQELPVHLELLNNGHNRKGNKSVNVEVHGGEVVIFSSELSSFEELFYD